MSASGRRVWVLNLDAETELATRGPYTRSNHLTRILRAQEQKLAESLVPAGDLVLSPDRLEELRRSGEARGLQGVAWSPTHSALGALETVGALAPAGTPSLARLAEVNRRPFATGVREALGELALSKATAHSLDEALEHLARPAELGWLVRRTFGAAGRGRRRIEAGRPSVEERAWLEASLREGPLTLEPWVEVVTEFTRSGFVHASGRVQLAAPTLQRTTREGAWLASELAAVDGLRREHDDALQCALEAAGQALSVAGYSGAFGIDAFLHRWRGALELNPMSEINARYTMDWALGFGDQRPDLE